MAKRADPVLVGVALFLLRVWLEQASETSEGDGGVEKDGLKQEDPLASTGFNALERLRTRHKPNFNSVNTP